MGSGGIRIWQRFSQSYDFGSSKTFGLQQVHGHSSGLLDIEICYPSERMDSIYTKEKGEFSLGFGGYTVKDFNRKTDIVDTDNSYWV